MKNLMIATILLCAAGYSGAASVDDVAEGRAMVQAARDDIIRTELNLPADRRQAVR